jgi:hypothetical protein
MIGSGGDKAAREDMFPTKVKDWQTEARVGGPPIGTGSSLGITNNPLEAQLAKLGSLRDAYPGLSNGASVVRLTTDSVIVVSRIDAATGKELVTAFNDSTKAARVTVQTATPGAQWSVAYGPGSAAPGAGSSLTLTLPPVSALLAVPAAGIPHGAPGAPQLTAGPDDLSGYDRLTASVAGPPVAVTFAVSRKGGPWRRVAIDDSAPYRGFVDPASFGKQERIRVVAVSRSLDGQTAVSKTVTFTPRP